MKKRDDLYVLQIQQRMERINQFLKGVSQSKFLKSELHKAAVIRELEIIGEAARLISPETKIQFPNIPWNQMVGMRNRLIHEYFSIDDTIVWEVAKKELPKLENEFEEVFLRTAPPSHPWRNCPPGYHYVHKHPRTIPPSKSSPGGETMVRDHCRKNPSGKDQLYPDEILLISDNAQLKSFSKRVGQLKVPKNANDFDEMIVTWTNYWNDVFLPKTPLSPNIVKALFFSESSFRMNVEDQKIRDRNFARGPLQISDETRKVLSDEDGELANHYLTLTSDDVRNPEIAIAAAVRWLFHKKDLASRYLKKDATWEEAIANYKGYLKRKKDFRLQEGMKNFFDSLNLLKGKNK